MPDSARRGYLDLQFSVRKSDASVPQEEPGRLRILVIGDFGGGSDRDPQAAQGPKGLKVDYDNFDTVVARVKPLVRLPTESDPAIHFHSLEDFHPDRLLLNSESLARLVELRKRLADPSTFEGAASAAKELLRVAPEPRDSVAQQPPDDVLNQLLGKPVSKSAIRTASASAVDMLIRQVFEKPPQPVGTETQATLQSAVEKELSNRLCAILHSPAFQALESTWRGLDFLVRNAGERALIQIADIPKSALPLLLRQSDSGDAPLMPFLSAFRPNLILGIYVFTVAEHPILEAMMRVCELCQTAFIAGAAAEWAGWNSFRSPNDRIQGAQLPENAQIASLRKSSEANRIGLVLPRFLLRQAYGSRSDPIETFPFEEIEPDPKLECHLWGNSAFLCGHLMSENFDESEFDAGQGGEVSGLPVQEITREGEVDVKPCAEVWLSEREEAAIRSRGIMPVVPTRGRDAVRIASLHSISKSLEALPVH